MSPTVAHEGQRRIWLLAALHGLFFLVAFTVGWTLGDSKLPARSPSRFWMDVFSIAANNSRQLIVLVVASLLTLGLAGVSLLVLNGFTFGWAVGSAGASLWLLLYAPLEVFAFAWAAGAALRVSVHTASCLYGGTGLDRKLLRHCFHGVLAAWGTLLPAAILEAIAIHHR